jgi:PAS domain S-box-containing protein
VLLQVGSSLTASQMDLEAIVQRVTDEATRLTGAEFGAFFYNVIGAEGESYLLYTLSGAPKEAFARLGLPRNTPIFAATFSGEGIVRLDDVKKDPRYGRLAPHHGMPAGHLPVTSYLAVPVVARTGEVLGGLFFGHSQPARFTAAHERVTKSLAASAALAIDNAKLFRASRDAEAAQRQVVEELRETVRVNELFVGVLAHDLRSPLAAIVTTADLMRSRAEGSSDPRNMKALNRLLTSGHRMGRMIAQLLDFTRIRLGGGLALSHARFDLGRLLHQVVDEVGAGSPASSIDVRQIGDTHGSWDEDRLGQVFSNLIGNALQHGVASDGVGVELDGRDPATVTIRVRNRGAIPAELLPRVFDPLTAREARHERPNGLGLGLFITRQIAKAHGGDVDVESSELTGTTFTVSLPRAPSPAAGDVALRAGEASAGGAAAPPHRDPLHESEARFRLLVEAVKDFAIFMLDPKGVIITWNEGARRIKGYAASEIIGQHFSRFYEESPGRDALCQRELEEAAREGRFEDEGWRVRKDGTKFWASVVITALRDPKGKLVGFAKVTRDLTERRRLHEEQIRLAKAQEAIRLRDEFLSLASHELKTPLTVLQMQLEALNDRLDASDQNVTTKLQRAARSSERLAGLVESLLDVSRLATGKFVLDLKEFDLGQEIARLVDNLRPGAQRAGCELTLVTHAPSPIVGVWDPLRVEQAVTNLISNAVRFGAGYPVEVVLRGTDREAVLEVRDHGPGIPEAEIGRMFGRFERASSMSHFGGLGLGLYLIKEITSAHGGSVSVSNAADGGARFELRLPLRPAAASAAPSEPARKDVGLN